jgi:hypothetical protein
MKHILIFLALVAALKVASAQKPVEPQPPRPDGSIVHVVKFGDTLEGILAAYAKYKVTVDALMVYNGWRFRPQFIFVDDQIVILPAGSVDPNTGELVAGFELPIKPTETPAEATAAPTPTPLAPEATAAPAVAEFPAEPSVPVFQEIEPFLPVAVVPTVAVTESVAPTEVAAAPSETSTPEPSPAATSEPTVEPSESAEISSLPYLAVPSGFVCARFFDDSNQNGRFETGEVLLTGGKATVGKSTQTAVEETVCFTDVPPGENRVMAEAPEGYGLTTSAALIVQVAAGETSEVLFGVSAGYVPPDTPVPAEETLTPPLPDHLQLMKDAEVENDEPFRIRDYAAFLVLALAGGVLLGGGLIIMALRSFR